MTERTLVIIKPDGVKKGLVEEIKEIYAVAGLKIIRCQTYRLLETQVEAIYQQHVGTFYFEGLVLSMISGPSVAMELEGEAAVELVRTLNGATRWEDAAPGSIRRHFRSAGGPFNIVHGSASEAEAAREIRITFGDEY